MTAPPPNALICESCGYALAGLPVTGACPECGWGVASSLPDLRTGSPWQRRKRWGWIATLTAALVAPRKLFDRVTIERPRSRALLLQTTLVAALPAGFVPIIDYTVFVVRVPLKPPSVWEAMEGSLAATIVTWVILLAISAAAGALAVVTGRFRSWRLDDRVATAVCGHASAGWLAGAVVFFGIECAALVIGLTARGNFQDAVAAALTAGLLFGAPFGLVWFLHLVHVGVQLCRFANPPGSDPHPTRESAPSHSGHCESCGYPLSGLSTGGVCPECGGGIWKSLSARHYGSTWQRGEHGAWFATIADFLLRPREGFTKITVERPRSRRLLATSLLVAAVLGSTPWMLSGGVRTYLIPPDNLRPDQVVFMVARTIAILWFAMMILVGLVSTLITLVGLSRDWRLTRDGNVAICAHAAAGWVVGAALVALTSLLGVLIWVIFDEGPLGANLAFGGLWVGAAIGFVWFACLAALGARACRFANPPQADPNLPA